MFVSLNYDYIIKYTYLINYIFIMLIRPKILYLGPQPAAKIHWPLRMLFLQSIDQNTARPIWAYWSPYQGLYEPIGVLTACSVCPKCKWRNFIFPRLKALQVQWVAIWDRLKLYRFALSLNCHRSYQINLKFLLSHTKVLHWHHFRSETSKICGTYDVRGSTDPTVILRCTSACGKTVNYK